MNATVSFLLCTPLLTTGLAAQQQVREPNEPKGNSRRPVDVSVEGLGEADRREPGDTTRSSSIELSARRTTESITPFDCIQSIADQSDTGGCLAASSTPTLGVLCPYPGLNNLFVPQAFVGGGENNQATGLHSTIGGGYGNVASGAHATIAGGYGNTASAPPGGRGTTIGGGERNIAKEAFATVGGGYSNVANEAFCTVGGGRNNRANEFPGIMGIGGYSTVGGGDNNQAIGRWATVAGGRYNTASGRRATVPGGSSNTAGGRDSFASGRRAKALHTGAFVWGDSVSNAPSPTLKTSSAPDEFNVYASGGVRMFTNIAATTGVLLAPGGSTWTMVCDRDAKENIEPVDTRAVLDKVSQLPLATWNYKDQDNSIRHMGPMAQDFYAAFGLGLGDKTIDTIDPNGVALAAIQGLNAEFEERLAEKNAEIDELRAQVKALTRRVNDLASSR